MVHHFAQGTTKYYPLREVLSARMLHQKPRVWEMQLDCGHTSLRVVRYEPHNYQHGYAGRRADTRVPRPAPTKSRCEHPDCASKPVRDAPEVETWRALPGHERFELSTLGRVRFDGRAVRPYPHPGGKGREYVAVTVAGRSMRLHRLMMLTWHPLPPGSRRLMVRHLDDDPKNNRLSNLAWGTQADNAADMLRNGGNAFANRTHCPQGHPYDSVNTLLEPRAKGKFARRCAVCRREQLERAWKRSAAKKRAARTGGAQTATRPTCQG